MREFAQTNGKQSSSIFTDASGTAPARHILTSPMGRTTTIEVDAQNHVKRVTRPGLPPLDYTYNQGHLSRVTWGSPGSGRVPVDRLFFARSTAKQSGYTQFLRSGSLATNGATTVGVSTEFLPDSFGRVLSQTTAGTTTASTWDGEGELLTLTPPGKPLHEFILGPTLTQYRPPLLSGTSTSTVTVRDQDGRTRALALPDGDKPEYVYHPTNGQLQKITSGQGDIVFAYQPVPACAGTFCACSTPGCAPGRLASAAGPSAVRLNFEYLGPLVAQNKTTKTGTDNLATTTLDWQYDNDLRPNVERLQSTAALGVPAYDARSPLTYNDDGQLTCVEASSATTCVTSNADAQELFYDATSGFLTGTKLASITDSYAYTPFGELKEYEAKNTTPDPDASLYKVTYDSVAYPRDFLGRVKRKTEIRNGVTKTFDYAYDAQGRLWTVTDATGTRTYTYDANGNRQLPGAVYDEQDRLTAANGSTYTYSLTGALKSKTTGSAIREFTYDNFGNLRTVVFKTGTTVTKTIDYLVDGLGRRVAKKVNGAVVKQYAYRNKLQLAAELDVATQTVRRFWYSTRANVPDFMEAKTATTSTLYRIVSDQLGSPQLVTNTATGAIVADLSYDEWGQVTGSGRGTLPFGFAGGLDDSDTELVRFGARDYAPEMGRWTNKDPILFNGRRPNLYAFAGTDPINRTDASGLWDIFLGADLDLVPIFGSEISFGIVFDTDHPLESGLFGNLSGGTGLSWGFSAQIGLAIGDIEGWGQGVDLNIGAISPTVGLSDGEFNSLALGYGPGQGISSSVGYTGTLSIGDLLGYLGCGK